MDGALRLGTDEAEELEQLLADIRTGRVGRLEVVNVERPASSCLKLAILLEFERQSHDRDSLAMLYPRLDAGTALEAGCETFDFLRDRFSESVGDAEIQEVALEVWAALDDAARTQRSEERRVGKECRYR